MHSPTEILFTYPKRMSKQSITDLNITRLQEEFASLSLPRYTARQVTEWIYKKRSARFEDMTNISKKNLSLLAEHFDTGRQPYSMVTTSADGTKKYLFSTRHGDIETVMIPDDDRRTLCVSCQVGCRMSCRFCMTGRCGFAGNLSAGEIINQVLSVDEAETITNIVFMGMGEPFDNLGEVLRAIEILTSEWGLAYSPKRITVSTSGLRKGIETFLDNTQCHLAISLHNPFADERAKMMPVEHSDHIEEVVTLLHRYDFAHQRRLSFEYIVFEGINDSVRHAEGIVRLLRGLFCRVNLIRFHEVADLDLRSPDKNKMEHFRDYLNRHGIISTIRRSRGEDIEAACGQLKNRLRARG